MRIQIKSKIEERNKMKKHVIKIKKSKMKQKTEQTE